MFCSRCGRNVEEGNRFCRNCGQEIGTPGPGAPGAANTPAQHAVGAGAALLPYAGFWVRFAAYIIDGLILAIPSWLVMMVMFFLFGGFALIARLNGINNPRAALAIFAPLIFGFIVGWLFLIVLQWLYFAGMESSGRQATFGKMAMSLQVTDLEGQRVSFGKATGRIFAKIVLALVPMGILTYLLAGFTEKKQALHDMVAGTLVMRRM